MMELQVQYIMW